MENVKHFSYIITSLETHLDLLYDIYAKIKNKKLIDAMSIYTNEFSADMWRWVFDELTIIYFASMTHTSVDELLEFGYPNIYKSIYKLKPGDDIKNHIELKTYILLDLIHKDSYMNTIIDKYIDKCFPELLINMSTYDYRPQSQLNSIISHLFSNVHTYNGINEKLCELVLAKQIRIYSMFIRLVNGLSNQSTFQSIIESKTNKIAKIYNSTDKIKSFNILSREWKTNSDFSIIYNYSNLQLLKISIPFYPINDVVQLNQRIPIHINGMYEFNTNSCPIDYIIYKKSSLVDISNIDNVYESYTIENFDKITDIHANDIRYVRNYKFIHTRKMYNRMMAKYFQPYSGHSDMVDKFIKHVINTKLNVNLVQDLSKKSFICIHESLLEELNRTTTIKDYRRVMGKLANLTPNQICNVCSSIVRLESEDVVMSPEIELLEEYYKLADFIRFTRIVVDRIAKIFDIYALINFAEHKNYIIQNLIEVLNLSKENEQTCSNIVEYNEESLYFIFSPTNNMYIQEVSIDKYVYRKIFNINVIIIILAFCSYSIKVKYEFYMLYDTYRPIYEKTMNKIGTKCINQSVLALFTYITILIIKYKLLYSENIDTNIKLKDRIKLYGEQIFKCLMNHILVIIRLGECYNSVLLKKQSDKLKNVLFTYSNRIDSGVYFTNKYTKYLTTMEFQTNVLKRKFRYSRILYYMYRKADTTKYILNCFIYCKDGKIHQLDNLKHMIKNNAITCKLCNRIIFDCNDDIKYTRVLKYYKLDIKYKLYTSIYENMYKLIQTIIKKTEKNSKYNIYNNDLLPSSTHADYTALLARIGKYINEDCTYRLYSRVWLRRDILKISLDGNNIYMSTSNKSLTLFWSGGRLMNTEFPDIQININLTRLGILIFNRIKNVSTFVNEIKSIVINSITVNLLNGYRSIGLLLIDRLCKLFKIYNEIKDYKFDIDNIIPIVKVNNNGTLFPNTKCILSNDYNKMLIILCHILYILDAEPFFVTVFIKKLNEYIDTQFIEYKNPEYLSKNGLFFVYACADKYPVNMFHTKPIFKYNSK